SRCFPPPGLPAGVRWQGRAWRLTDRGRRRRARGTLARLRGHIETSGGRAIGAAALTGSEDGARMALAPATEKHLRETCGDALEQYLQQEFSFGVAQPTEGEAAPIRKARTLDEVRNRVAQTRCAAGA